MILFSDLLYEAEEIRGMLHLSTKNYIFGKSFADLPQV
jgi:hypothetical protein